MTRFVSIAFVALLWAGRVRPVADPDAAAGGGPCRRDARRNDVHHTPGLDRIWRMSPRSCSDGALAAALV